MPISAPARKTFHSQPPHGCCRRIRYTSPSEISGIMGKWRQRRGAHRVAGGRRRRRRWRIPLPRRRRAGVHHHQARRVTGGPDHIIRFAALCADARDEQRCPGHEAPDIGQFRRGRGSDDEADVRGPARGCESNLLVEQAAVLQALLLEFASTGIGRSAKHEDGLLGVGEERGDGVAALVAVHRGAIESP